jgi:hypothetical protein
MPGSLKGGGGPEERPGGLERGLGSEERPGA